MSKLTIASDHQHFERNGKPFFWVGDTLWSAFTNPTFEEWEEYLEYRKAQGFNVIQINTLPQWDRVQPDLGIYPYPIREDGSMDYNAEPNMEYVKRAQKILSMAVEKGFTPGPTWCRTTGCPTCSRRTSGPWKRWSSMCAAWSSGMTGMTPSTL